MQGLLLLRSQNVNLQWVKQMGGADPSDARGFSIVTDASGNVYTTGFFKGRIDFDPGPAIYNLDALGVEDLYVSKLDSFGKFLWVRQMDVIADATSAKSRDIAVSAAGDVFITGTFLKSAGNGKCFVSKFNAAGNLNWTKQMGESSSGTSIEVDALGNVYTIGTSFNQSDFDPGPGIFNLGSFGNMMFVSKLDANGNFVWAKEIKGSVTDEPSIALEGLQNIYISGAFFGEIDCYPGPALYNLTQVPVYYNTKDIFVLKLDRDGSFVWAKQMGGLYEDLSVSTAVDNSGNIYTVGDFAETADFDPGSGTYNLTSANGNSSTFISKLDGNGNFVWAKQLVGGIQWCYSATIDSYGNIYTTGYFGSALDFDPGPGVYNLSTSNYDVFISKLDANGNFLWAKQLGGTATIISNSIAVDAMGKIYTVGYFFSGQIDFDPGPGNYYLTSGNGENIFVHKMGQCKTTTSPSITESACKSYTLNGQTYNTSGVYTQTLTNAAGCDSIITLNLTINASSSTTIATSICAGQSFNGHTANGLYTDTLVAANGCDSIITLQLAVLPKPSPNLGVDASLCVGDSLLLYPGKFTTYTWHDGSAQDRITIKKPGLYSVRVTDICGSATDEIIIKEVNCNIYFPNAFTPNNDGLNDLFKILGPNNLTEYRLSVYNRWGQKVFETVDSSKGWNGSFKGQLQSPQTFIWHCEFKRRGDTNKILMKGIVTLLR